VTQALPISRSTACAEIDTDISLRTIEAGPCPITLLPLSAIDPTCAMGCVEARTRPAIAASQNLVDTASGYRQDVATDVCPAVTQAWFTNHCAILASTVGTEFGLSNGREGTPVVGYCRDVM
jgi:hypothetical protein